jgi:2-methylcitrate dehydratase PrpD
VLIHHRPTTSLEAKFSLEYLLAAGLALKTINEECFDLKHVSDPVMRDLVAKVRIVDSPAQREIPGEGPVSLQVRTQTAVYEETVSYAPGHPKNPLSWDRLAAKYQACARQGGLGETIIASSLHTLSHIDEIANVRELMQLFAA